MSYLVCHMQKLKAGNLGGIQRHNQRETSNHKNKDIDKDRTYLNYDLINKQRISYQEKIHNHIDRKRKSSRAVRKDAVLLNSFVVSSDKDFFEGIGEDETKRFFKVSTDFFKERYGDENVAFAQVHLDEKTPHMHLGVIPITEDGALSSKRIFNRTELTRLQDEFPKYLQQHDFNIERGLEGSEAGHKDPERYKSEIQREIKTLEREKSGLASEVKNLRSDNLFLETQLEVLRKEKEALEIERERFKRSLEQVDDEPIRAMKRMLRNESGEVIEDKENVIVPIDEFKQLEKMKQSIPVLMFDNDENERLIGNWRSKFYASEKAHEELKETLKMAKRRIGDYVEGGSEIWDRCITYSHQFHKSDDYAGKVNEEILDGMTTDPKGLDDYEKWKDEARRHQQQRNFQR